MVDRGESMLGFMIGRAIQRLGAARAMRLGLVVAALLLIVFPLQVDPILWFLLRLVFGAATAIADLFAGCGTFTLPLSVRAPVHAVEGDARLVHGQCAGPVSPDAGLVAQRLAHAAAERYAAILHGVVVVDV